MSTLNNPEVEIAIDPMSSPPPSFDGPFLGERRTPTVYLCGLLPKRYHNQSLYAIAHDLMPDYFVSTNPIQPNRWNADTTRDMLSRTEALLFLMNEVTVVDRRCLFTLQYAWHLNVPIVMLRQPRVRLIIKPASAAVKSTINHNFDPSMPNMPLLQDVIYEAYKTSIEYDRNNHLAGMRRIIIRLRHILETDRKARLDCPQEPINANHSPKQPHYLISNNTQLKLPPIPSPPNAGGIGHRRNTIGPTGLPPRSSSMGNLNRKEAEIRRKEPNGNTEWPRPNGHHDSNNGKHGNDQFLHLMSPVESTNDPALYHETQYLVFSLRNKNQNPRLIRFPSALTDKHDDDVQSIWGSDTSLEEEAERAERVAGGLDVVTPPDTPAPYIDPI